MSQRLWIVVLFGIAIRLFIVASLEPAEDVYKFAEDSLIIQRGGNLYYDQPYYNYSPLFAYFLAGLDIITGNIPFIIVYRIMLVLTDLMCGLLLSRIYGRKAWFAWMLNPSLWFMHSFGQFDLLSLAALLGAILLAKRHHKAIAVWALGTLSILIKQITLPAVWGLYVAFFGFKRAFIAMCISVGALILTILPFWSGASTQITIQVLRYPDFSHATLYYTYGFLQFVNWDTSRIIFILAAFFVPAYFSRKHTPEVGAQIGMMTLFTFSYSVFPMYTVLGLMGEVGLAYWLWSALSLFGLSGLRWDLGSMRQAMLLLWPVAAVWLIQTIRNGPLLKISKATPTSVRLSLDSNTTN